MYGYAEHISLTQEQILSRVTEKDIFGILVKEPILEGKDHLYKAPYRNDEHANCWFETYNNNLYFIDFANIGKKTFGCFVFIQESLKLSFAQTLRYIHDYFHLENCEILPVIPTENSCIARSPRDKRITYAERPFENKDKRFWSKYGISRQNLIDDGVKAISMYRYMSKKYREYFIVTSYCYAYTDFPEGKLKIYNPFTEDKLAKWLTNCTQHDVGGIRHLPDTGSLLIITKSYKDWRVLKNLGYVCVWFQNEGMMPNNEILIDLCARFTRIIVWFDNDSAGLGNGLAVTSFLNGIVPNKAKFLSLPPVLLQEHIKDPSDFYAAKGEQALREFTLQKIII